MTLTNQQPKFHVACRVSWLGDESMWCRDMLVFHKKGWREMEGWSSWARSDGWGYRVATVTPNHSHFPPSPTYLLYESLWLGGHCTLEIEGTFNL